VSDRLRRCQTLRYGLHPCCLSIRYHRLLLSPSLAFFSSFLHFPFFSLLSFFSKTSLSNSHCFHRFALFGLSQQLNTQHMAHNRCSAGQQAARGGYTTDCRDDLVHVPICLPGSKRPHLSPRSGVWQCALCLSVTDCLTHRTLHSVSLTLRSPTLARPLHRWHPSSSSPIHPFFFFFFLFPLHFHFHFPVMDVLLCGSAPQCAVCLSCCLWLTAKRSCSAAPVLLCCAAFAA